MPILSEVRNRAKQVFDRISNERVKKNILQAIPFWVGSLLTGLVAVLYAHLFSWAEAGTAWVMDHYRWGLFLLTPVCFLLAWWLVVRWSPFARGSGIPQVIAAIELATPRDAHKTNRLLSLRVLLVKIGSSLLMVFGGGIVGREGPTIQIAGSIFRKVNQWLPSWWPAISKRNMILTGAAAGLAAAFNTPLGGFVFTVEELTKTHISFFRTALFTAIIIAGLTAQALLGPYLYLGYPDVNNLSPWLFFTVILVAIVAGSAGAGMAKLILRTLAWAGALSRSRKAWYVAGCALLVAAMGYFFHSAAIGSGKEIMTHTLFTADKHLPWYLPLLRMLGSLVSFTTGAAGGVFAPSLSAGAAIGSVLSGWLELSPTNTNLIILAGMVAFLTGVTRTPFTSAILVLEMTDRHGVIFHLMLAAMIAGLAAYLIDKRSFYDHLKTKFVQELEKQPAQKELLSSPQPSAGADCSTTDQPLPPEAPAGKL